MFDFGLTKMAMIGVIALVVLGPKRLPGVARTAGALLGRAQRYVDDVKAEVAREIELDSLKGMRSGFESAVQDVGNKVHDVLRSQESELDHAWKANASMPENAVNIDSSGILTSIRKTSQAKRRNWRVKQSAIPNWYKRATARKTRRQSRAVRMTGGGLP